MKINFEKDSINTVLTLVKVFNSLSGSDIASCAKLLLSEQLDISNDIDTETICRLSKAINVIAQELPFDGLCDLLCQTSGKLRINTETKEYIESMSKLKGRFRITFDDNVLKMELK